MAHGLSLYAEGSSFLHRAHPLTKGTLTLCAIALAFIVPDWQLVLGIGLSLLLSMTAAGVLRRFLLVAVGLLAPITLLLALVQSLANPLNHTVLVPLGPLAIHREGLLIGLMAASRIADLVAATFLFSFTTRPADLAEALLQRGLSPRIGYVVQSALQIIPQTLELVERIRDAQRARGLETSGPLPRRARAFIPLLLPLVLSALVATQERAMALEVRGFGLRVPRRARYHIPDSPRQRLLRWGLALAVIAVLASRLRGWR